MQEQGLSFRIRPGEGLAVGLYLDTRQARAGPGTCRRAHLAQLLLLHRRLRGRSAGGGRGPRSRRRPQPALARVGRGECPAERQAPPETDRLVGDVFEWLKRFGKRGERFDAVVLDPPGFARGRSGTFSAARDWPDLAAQAAALVAPGGWLLAACNVASLSGRRFDAALAEGVRRAGRTAEEVARPGASDLDFPSPAGEEPPLKVRVLRLRGANLRKALTQGLPVQRSGGLRFGKYALLDRLAVGGMAEIFLARQEGLEGFEKTVVIKRIRPHLSKQTNFVKMFLNEARLAAQLNHPNIVQIYDLGRSARATSSPWSTSSGGTCGGSSPRPSAMGIPFPMVYALKIASSVCEGLYYAHQKADLYGQPAGHRPPRRHAGEHLRVLRRHGEGPRLRHRQGARTRSSRPAPGRSRASSAT